MIKIALISTIYYQFVHLKYSRNLLKECNDVHEFAFFLINHTKMLKKTNKVHLQSLMKQLK